MTLNVDRCSHDLPRAALIAQSHMRSLLPGSLLALAITHARGTRHTRACSHDLPRAARVTLFLSHTHSLNEICPAHTSSARPWRAARTCCRLSRACHCGIPRMGMPWSPVRPGSRSLVCPRSHVRARQARADMAREYRRAEGRAAHTITHNSQMNQHESSSTSRNTLLG